jgi:RNA recognition motif-containing protein
LVSLNEAKKKKLITQVKILRDAERMDPETNEKAPSGLGFCQFGDEALALYAINYLNNIQLEGGTKKGGYRGLIVDMSLEDSRINHKREVRRDKAMKEIDQKKREKKIQLKK